MLLSEDSPAILLEDGPAMPSECAPVMLSENGSVMPSDYDPTMPSGVAGEGLERGYAVYPTPSATLGLKHQRLRSDSHLALDRGREACWTPSAARNAGLQARVSV